MGIACGSYHLIRDRVWQETRQSSFAVQLKKEVKTRFAMPTATTAKRKVELGGELADLATFEDIAESQSFGMTFDGCTLNMYSVFGGGVCILKQNGEAVRKMAFADMVGRETVANKMRKFQEFFARGRQCMELAQHPLAHRVCLERCGATNSDRGGADGCTGDALKAKIVELVVGKLGREEWAKATQDEKDSAIIDAEDEDNWELWERAAVLYADEQLNAKHLDPEHVALPFDELSEMTQILRVASFMLGWESYEVLDADKRVVMVKLYCLEHALSNVLVQVGEGMATVARELIPAFIPEGSKVKAFVEVATSPGNKFILSFCKLFAPCSDKDYAKAFDFQAWEAYTYGQNTTHDLMSILGSRFGVFFLNPVVILRAWDHAKEYLVMLGKIETYEGKLRAATLSAMNNPIIKAEMAARALICNYIYWPWMKLMNGVGHVRELCEPLQYAGLSLQNSISYPGELLTGQALFFGFNPKNATTAAAAAAAAASSITATGSAAVRVVAAAAIANVVAAAAAPHPVSPLTPAANAVYTPPVDIQRAAALATSPELGESVRRFLVKGLTQALPTFMKHTDGYQAGGNVAEASERELAALTGMVATTHHQEADFGFLQYLVGTKGRARHQKVRSAVGHAKLRRTDVLQRVREMSPEKRRRWFAIAKLMLARRINREGSTRKEIACNHAASIADHREGLVRAADERIARDVAQVAKLEAIEPVLDMGALHSMDVAALKLQLARHKTISKRKLVTGKALTQGGTRIELLERLCSVLSQIDEAKASVIGYEADKPKGFYASVGADTIAASAAAAAASTAADTSATNASATNTSATNTSAADTSADDTSAAAYTSTADTTTADTDGNDTDAAATEAERITNECELIGADRIPERVEEISEQNGEAVYLIKWMGLTPEENTWVPESGLDLHSLELVATAEQAACAESVPTDEGVCNAEAVAGEEGDADLFFVEALVDRRISRKTGTREYLVRWGGFGPEEDSWEVELGLPLDMRVEYDDSQRVSQRPSRGARVRQ